MALRIKRDDAIVWSAAREKAESGISRQARYVLGIDHVICMWAIRPTCSAIVRRGEKLDCVTKS